jgi:aryl-alcohol dehydrogenase-like predicted oxidoreductase
MIERCLDAGVKMFDTANTYTEGRSEEMLGRIVAPMRDQVLLASKVGGQGSEHPLAADSIRLEVDGSLRRLGTDYLDLYYLHRPDPSTQLEESLMALRGLVESGKVRNLGVSNYAAWQIAELLHLAGDGPAPTVSQPMYNLLARRIEEEYVAFSTAHGLRNVVYNPLAGGFLTGKHRSGDAPLPGTRFRNKNYQRRYWNDEQFRAVDELSVIAADAGLSLVELALRWLRSRPAVTSILLGASSLDQLDENLRAALDGPTPDEDTCNRIDEVWATLRGVAPAYNR